MSTRCSSSSSTRTAASWRAPDGVLRASPPPDARDSVLTFAIDLWNVGFERAGDHSFRLLVDGSERKRLPLVVDAARPGDRRPTDPTGS